MGTALKDILENIMTEDAIQSLETIIPYVECLGRLMHRSMSDPGQGYLYKHKAKPTLQTFTQFRELKELNLQRAKMDPYIVRLLSELLTLRKEIRAGALRSDESGVAKLSAQIDGVQKRQKSQGQAIHDLGTVVKKINNLRNKGASPGLVANLEKVLAS